jgi:hypothetical protein
MLGRRPRGAVAKNNRVKPGKDGEIVAYIQNRSGEYDDIERQILSDPWVEGWETREAGLSALLIPFEPLNIRPEVRAERYELKVRGWNDCEEWIKRSGKVAI